MEDIIGMLCASLSDLTNCSISNAAFLRLSYDRSPRERCTNGGRGDSTETSTGPDLLCDDVGNEEGGGGGGCVGGGC